MNDTPEVTVVPVKRYDVNLTLEDVLTPLVQMSSRQSLAAPGAELDPQVAEHVRKLSELASQLKEVVVEINRLHPTLLAPGERPR